ncbi:uncharacterized protein SOCE26_066760 [Sorangium cellulosum]|uniref:LysR substrate-binding domain-containing protein n=1 Tax=Sorangium cellulosum TaxID=56 RepID=A0A2L0F0W2_SORCE|nr:hypothetical protein [Sorangium cellulosum]AUX45195.1 uncharacterized protein SOCE26_066760 [Sorangium cellulosum]
MIALPASGGLRLVVVGSPAYIARHPEPTHPRDLVDHECINWHPTEGAAPMLQQGSLRDGAAPLTAAYGKPHS